MDHMGMTNALYAGEDHTAKCGTCTGFTLKMIAVVTMLIDHTAATILERALTCPSAGYITTAEAYNRWLIVYQIMRGIGRMAFPLYCFLLVEGFVHTRNVKKYLGRMAVFALISEIPFDMAFNRSFFDMSYNSVFLTLFLGLAVITLVHKVDDKLQIQDRSLLHRYLKCIAIVAVILAGMILAELLHTDYSAAGVAAIAIMYVLRSRRMAAFAAGVVTLGLLSGTIEFLALFMLIPIWFYNGKRGHSAKYFFYAFYPVHLFLLSIICWFMGLGI